MRSLEKYQNIDDSNSQEVTEKTSLSRDQFLFKLRQRFKDILCPAGTGYINSPQKRVFDVIGSIALMPVVAPVIVGAAIAIKLEDGGPIFYTVEVPGQNGDAFGMIKLRSMKLGSEADDQSNETVLLPKHPDNPRITRVGKFIRKWSIDELPQLINVLKGEMSLVGNRPMFPERIEVLGSVSQLDDLRPKWVQTFSIARPGMAGLATSRGRAELDQSEQGLRRRLRYESFFVTHDSLGLDIKLIVDSIKAAISRRGAF